MEPDLTPHRRLKVRDQDITFYNLVGFFCWEDVTCNKSGFNGKKSSRCPASAGTLHILHFIMTQEFLYVFFFSGVFALIELQLWNLWNSSRVKQFCVLLSVIKPAESPHQGGNTTQLFVCLFIHLFVCFCVGQGAQGSFSLKEVWWKLRYRCVLPCWN